MLLCKNISRITSESITSQQRLERALAMINHLRMPRANTILNKCLKIFIYIYIYIYIHTPPDFTNTMNRIKLSVQYKNVN